jgi:hypothetical protein
MKENLRLFLPSHAERHEHIMKKKVREFILGCKSLEQFLSLGANADERDSMKFYASLYEEMSPLLTTVDCFITQYGYKRRRQSFEDAIKISQKVMLLLKVLHIRYITSMSSTNPFEDFRWYEITDKSNTEVVDQISKLLKETYSLKLKG